MRLWTIVRSCVPRNELIEAGKAGFRVQIILSFFALVDLVMLNTGFWVDVSNWQRKGRFFLAYIRLLLVISDEKSSVRHAWTEISLFLGFVSFCTFWESLPLQDVLCVQETRVLDASFWRNFQERSALRLPYVRDRSLPRTHSNDWMLKSMLTYRIIQYIDLLAYSKTEFIALNLYVIGYRFRFHFLESRFLSGSRIRPRILHSFRFNAHRWLVAAASEIYWRICPCFAFIRKTVSELKYWILDWNENPDWVHR